MRYSIASALVLGFGLLSAARLEADQVSWGDNITGNAGTGILDVTSIPTSGSAVFSNVNGGGYDIVITTTALNFSGTGNLGDVATPSVSWSLEGGAGSGTAGSIPYSTVNVRFYEAGTSVPFDLTGVEFKLVDAEIDERFKNFSYYTADGTAVPFTSAGDPWGYSNPILSTSAAHFNLHATDLSLDTGLSAADGTQTGKWIQLNMSSLSISGFQFQAGRLTTDNGSVEMTALGNLVHPVQVGAGAVVATGNSYQGLTSTSTVPGGAGTKAQLLGGTASTNTTVTVDFSLVSTSGFQAGAGHLSDVVSLSGTDGDKVVLQLSYDETALAPGQLESDVFLGWFDPSDSTLKNAVVGNSDGGASAHFVAGPYDPSVDFNLGYYGVDTTNDTVWAVIDHNSQFTVTPAPEPASAGLAAIGALTLLARRRRKR
ncbi:MAG: hypothetical protein P4L99_06650 [Chthoniobacter sp.]|nr:hypothetical protein [Chthoniobacter sp.]